MDKVEAIVLATGLSRRMGERNKLLLPIEAHLTSDSAKISVPYHMETRGNPIIVPTNTRPRLLAGEANPGCGKFTRSNPKLARQVPLSRSGFYYDIDAPAAFAAFQQLPLVRTTP